MIEPNELIERWMSDEATMRAYGQDGPADVLRQCRQDLETWWRERELDELTLTEAAEHSGYAYSTIQKKVASGELRNVGEKNKPRVYRGDLPTRPERTPRTETGEPDLAEIILRNRMNAR